MRPAFLGFNIARSALFTHQQQLDITGHNIANASVEGYSRQRLDVKAAPDIYGLGQQYPGAVGGGVQAEQLQRLRDELLDRDWRRHQQDYSSQLKQKEYLERLEFVVGSLGETGLQQQSEIFFNSWQELSQRPEDLALRRVMAEEAANLSSLIRDIDAEAAALQADASSELRSSVERVNQISSLLAELNTQIRQRSGLGDTPADLLDERDRLLDELAGFARIQVDTDDFGAVQVQIDGKAIVDKDEHHDIQLFSEPEALRGRQPIGFPVTLDNGDMQINGVDIIGSDAPITINSPADYGLLINQINSRSSSTGVVAGVDPAGQLLLSGLREGSSYVNLQVNGDGLQLSAIEGGQYTLSSREHLRIGRGTYINGAGGTLQALQQVRNQEIPRSMERLNALVNDLIERTNDIHSNAFDLSGNTGQPFFTGNHPANMNVANSLLSDPRRIAIAADASFPPGDGSQARAIYNLRNHLGLDEDIQGLITDLGTRIDSLSQREAQLELVQEQIENQRQSVAGVNLDEELSRMLQFQRAFSASARVMNTLDEMLNQVVNGLGLVGR